MTEYNHTFEKKRKKESETLFRGNLLGIKVNLDGSMGGIEEK